MAASRPESPPAPTRATGERIVLCETAATRRDAERALTRPLAEADAWRSARTKASFGALLDRWLAGHEVAITTRVTYESLIRNHIRPALGTVPLTKLQPRRSNAVIQARCRVPVASIATTGGRPPAWSPTSRVNSSIPSRSTGKDRGSTTSPAAPVLSHTRCSTLPGSIATTNADVDSASRNNSVTTASRPWTASR
jgi:hypothetical protein